MRAPALQADFGLSKTLPINKHAEFGYLDSKFRLTGETGECKPDNLHLLSALQTPQPHLGPPPMLPGSYRYMAPEVFRHEPYNSRVDVYSFSMIVYQLFEVSRVAVRHCTTLRYMRLSIP